MRDYDEIQLIIIASNFTGHNSRPHADAYGKKWSKLVVVVGGGGFPPTLFIIMNNGLEWIDMSHKKFLRGKMLLKIMTLEGLNFKKNILFS